MNKFENFKILKFHMEIFSLKTKQNQLSKYFTLI